MLGWPNKIQIRQRFCYSLLSLFSPQPHISVPKAKLNQNLKGQYLGGLQNPALPMRLFCISVSPPTGETTYRQLKCL